MINHVLRLAAAGFYIFPLPPGKKTPPVFRAFWQQATRDPEILRLWWRYSPLANPAICTTHDNLLVIDVDVRFGQLGLESFRELPPVPRTYWQRTASGGLHFVFRLPPGVPPIANTSKKLGPGLDTRGFHGYIVGAGARTEEGEYTGGFDIPVAEAPQWLIERARSAAAQPHADEPAPDVNQDEAHRRAVAYLAGLKPAVPGERGIAGYRAACTIRGFGLAQEETIFLMLEDFRCDPPPPPGDIEEAVVHAYQYAQGAPGDRSPEAAFAGTEPPPPPPPQPEGEPAPGHPGAGEDAGGWLERMNRKYAFVIMGNQGCVLRETTDHEGVPVTRLWPLATFKAKMANRTLQVAGRVKEVSELWMRHPQRREYEGMVFAPGRALKANWYNLWRGWACEPLAVGEAMTPIALKAMEDFLSHAHDNICSGIEIYFQRVMGWFAHMIQRPWEKPLTALILRGGKGTGKDTFLDILGSLLGEHYMTTPRRKMLVGDFNGHMEHLLLFNLAEAVWAKDNAVQSVLNDLITNRTQQIERKGLEVYKAPNRIRIVMQGNVDQAAPVTFDERRYLMLTVHPGRQREKEYFYGMRIGMAAGGNRALLRYLQQFDLSKVDIDEPLETPELNDQKLGNLDSVHRWWRECLCAGWLVSGGLGATVWQTRVDKTVVRDAYLRWRKENQVPGTPSVEIYFGRRLHEACPSVDASQKRTEGKLQFNQYRFPDLAQCRQEWNSFIKFQDLVWEAAAP